MIEELEVIAQEAWLYGLPAIEMATTRTRALARGARQNSFHHVGRLLTPRDRDVTLPNNDTLYSSAHLDLSQGGLTLTLPASGERYLSVAFIDAWTNNFAILGTRTTGAQGGTFRLVGPASTEHGPMVLRSPTDFVWALARVLVDGPSDLEAARMVQQAIGLEAPEAPAWTPLVARDADWPDYFAALHAMMRNNPPPVTDLALLRRIVPLGLTDASFDASRFTAEEREAIARGVVSARTLVRSGGGIGARVRNGWIEPGQSIGDFGQDYRYRAAVALKGLAAMPSVEALYLIGRGPDRGAYDGRRQWRLRFAPDQLPPVNAFWSLAMYEIMPDGQMFLTENPLQRYSIGDRTPGLRLDPDGGLTILIGAREPSETANWLPAPDGPFALAMRAYLPAKSWLDGAYELPALEAAN